MSAQPAARVEDPIAHTQAKTGMLLGILAGVAVGAVIVGATIATGGAALAVAAAVGGAAGLTSFGGLSGMNIGAAMMGPPTGQLKTGSFNVLVNGRMATMTAAATAICSHHAGPIPLATGSSTVLINGRLAGRQSETMGCSAIVVAQCSPDVLIGGASAGDPDVKIKPEVAPWAVDALVALGLAGAIMALPFAIATVGVAATIAGGVGGFFGGKYAGQAGRALGERLGMSEAGIRAMEAGGQFFGGMAGGAAGARGTQAFNSRYQIKVDPNTLGMNGGNIRIVPRQPPAPTRSPFQTRYDPANPGRPDPRWSVDTQRFDPNAPTAGRTATGEIRDQRQFWSEWSQRHPETLSRGNQYRINELGRSPRVDRTWTDHFPEHRGFNRQVLEHHHYNQGPIAIPLPQQVHRGAGNYGTWHGNGP